MSRPAVVAFLLGWIKPFCSAVQVVESLLQIIASDTAAWSLETALSAVSDHS